MNAQHSNAITGVL